MDGPIPNIIDEDAPNQQEPPRMDGPVPNIIGEAAPNQQEPPEMVENDPIIFDFDIGLEVEVPFEIDPAAQIIAEEIEVPINVDPAAQIMSDLQMAQDMEMAELLAFEINHDDSPTFEWEPKPQRNKRSTKLFRNVDFTCGACGKKMRRTDLPAEAAVGFICSNCMT